MNHDKQILNQLLYGKKKFIYTTYTQYKIKRDGLFGIFGKKRLVKVCDGVIFPYYDENIDLSVADNGMMIGDPEAMEIYRGQI